MWKKLLKSSGISWDKTVRPDYAHIFFEFNLLQEDGYEILLEDGSSLLKVEEVAPLWKKLTKSLGITWNKIK